MMALLHAAVAAFALHPQPVVGELGAARLIPAAAQISMRRMEVTSSKLKNNEDMPLQFTPDGRNDSPPLAWANVPKGTKSFAVICQDPDAGNPPPFVHWIMYNIPGTVNELPEALPFEPGEAMPGPLKGAIQGLSGFGRQYYRGPAPPPGKIHHYNFVVYALDTAPNLEPRLNKKDFMDQVSGHILAEGTLVSLYERKYDPARITP